MGYDLHCEFDLELHKVNYPHYLEVCIDEDGKVHYAIPSHQEFMINYSCNKLNVTREELSKMCPQEFYFDFINWLCQISGLIPVWTHYYQGVPNTRQKETLELLIEEKVLEV